MAITKGGAAAVEKNEGDEAADLAPATDFAASGAIIEPGVVDAVDMDHPAVDNHPRANTTKDMNRIDFNDPTLSPEEAVIENLKARGEKVLEPKKAKA